MAKIDNVHKIVMRIYKNVTKVSHLSELDWESGLKQDRTNGQKELILTGWFLK
jgi:hypothetical protein